MDHLISLINIDKSQATPIYMQIVERIIELVKNGGLNPGDKLPTERELADALGIARGTISKAYESLEQNNIIEVVQGSGSFISKKQDVLIEGRKEKAIHELEKVIGELEKLKFNHKEISTFFQIVLLKRERALRDINIAVIDCNTESLALFEKQLIYISQVKIHKLLLSDIINDPKRVERLKQYDLIWVTTAHYKEIIAAIPELKDHIHQGSVTLGRQTIIDFAQIAPNVPVGVICQSSRFFEIIKRHLGTFQIDPNNVSCLLEDDETDLSNFLKDKRVVVLRPQSPVEQMPRFMSALAQFSNAGGKVIYFTYQIDRATLIQIEEQISSLMQDHANLEGEF